MEKIMELEICAAPGAFSKQGENREVNTTEKVVGKSVLLKNLPKQALVEIGKYSDDEEILAELLLIDDEEIWFVLAGNTKSGEDTLDSLARIGNVFVQREVARNETTSERTLDFLSDVPDDVVIAGICSHKNSSESIRCKMFKKTRIGSRARLNLLELTSDRKILDSVWCGSCSPTNCDECMIMIKNPGTSIHSLIKISIYIIETSRKCGGAQFLISNAGLEQFSKKYKEIEPIE